MPANAIAKRALTMAQTEMNTKPTESMIDFKARIAQLMRGRAGGEVYDVIGAARSHSCVVRKPTDRGYYAPTRKTNTNAKTQ